MLMPNVIHEDDRHLRQRQKDAQGISKEYDYQNTIVRDCLWFGGNFSVNWSVP